MKNQTDLEYCKKQAKFLFNLVPIEPVKDIPFFCQHPYTNSPYVCGKDKQLGDASKDEKIRQAYQDLIFEYIDTRNDVYGILSLIRSPYYLFFFSLIKDGLSNKDYGELLKTAWTGEDNPNDDTNVKLYTIVSWFKKAEKTYLMDEEELEKYNSLPEKFKVYRGVGKGRKHNGLSYTLDYDKALWFANRWGGDKNYIIECEVNKDDTFAYFDCRGEHEIVVNTFSKAIKNSMKTLLI